MSSKCPAPSSTSKKNRPGSSSSKSTHAKRSPLNATPGPSQPRKELKSASDAPKLDGSHAFADNTSVEGLAPVIKYVLAGATVPSVTTRRPSLKTESHGGKPSSAILNTDQAQKVKLNESVAGDVSGHSSLEYQLKCANQHIEFLESLLSSSFKRANNDELHILRKNLEEANSRIHKFEEAEKIREEVDTVTITTIVNLQEEVAALKKNLADSMKKEEEQQLG